MLRDNSGLTLLEVLVAASLLLLVMFGLMQFYVRGRTQLDYEEDRRKATAVAQDRLDSLRRITTYEILSDMNASVHAAHVALVDDTTYTVDGRTFTVHHTVTPAFPESLATTVKVTVTWNAKVAGGNVPRTLEATTILAKGMP